MSDGYQADPTKIDNVGTDFDNTNKKLQGVFHNLDTQMRQTTHDYQSVAGDEFRLLMQAYNQDAENLNQALAKIAQMLHTQASEYNTIQQKTRDVISQARQSIQNKLQAN